MHDSRQHFTLDVLKWVPWLNTAAAPNGSWEDGLEVDVLSVEGGLGRADCALSVVVVARTIGCSYAASIQGRILIGLIRRPDLIRAIFEREKLEGLDDRQRAIIRFSSHLTATPSVATKEDFAELRQAGLSELEILDLVHVIAIFSASARRRLTLGAATPASLPD